MQATSISTFFLSSMLALACAATVAAQGPAPIRDNSFLIEEAHNQEKRVVQHISSFLRQRSGDWAYAFTQEWPIHSEKHQLSVTLPVEHLALPGSSRTGVGDAYLNYRFQATMLQENGVAIAPRFSLVVPTGSSSRGFGSGRLGVDLNLPVSLEPRPWLALHINAGATLMPGGDSSRVFAGTSAIWLVRPTANLMLEVLHSIDRNSGTKDSETILLPGVRFAINHRSGLQIVPGFGLPIRMSGGPRERIGIFAYVSFEHPF